MTSIREDNATDALRALVLAQLDRIEWRHHGIGALQGYIRENADPEVRVHIWSKRLLKPGIAESGDIHDHRFDMVSHVLSGIVIHEEVFPFPDPDGDHVMLGLTHARAAAASDYHGPTQALPGRYSVRFDRYHIKEGSSYFFPRQHFHHSPIWGGPDDVAVTVIEKRCQTKEPARLLYPADTDPVMAFGHKIDDRLVRQVVEMAYKKLAFR